VRALIRHRKKIRVALYPDYATAILPVPRNIEYIVPVHDLSAFEVLDRLVANGYTVWAGYASDPRYRDYTMWDFKAAANGFRTWYLGASAMWELHEAITNNMDGVDITGYIIGNNDIRKDAIRAPAKVKEIALRVASVAGEQIRLIEIGI
jgi:hypothetical protein